MKKMRMMFILILLSTLLLGVLSVVDFVALHDIRKDVLRPVSRAGQECWVDRYYSK